MVERARADQPDLLHRREHELDPGVRKVLAEHAPHALEHRRNRRLVVAAEDRAARVADDAVLDDRLELPVGRHRVHVRAEEERRPLGGRLDPRVDVARGRADLRAAGIFVRLEPETAQIAEHDVRDAAFLARWARDRGKLEEKVGGLGHAPILGAASRRRRARRPACARGRALRRRSRGRAASPASAGT